MIEELGSGVKVPTQVMVNQDGQADVVTIKAQFAARMVANIQRRPKQQPRRTKRARVTLIGQTSTTTTVGIKLVVSLGQGVLLFFSHNQSHPSHEYQGKGDARERAPPGC